MLARCCELASRGWGRNLDWNLGLVFVLGCVTVTHMTTRAITATAPDGTPVATTGLGAKRVVGAIRIMQWPDGTHLVTVHKTLDNAITGPNQTSVWNKYSRWAIAIDENDQPVGPWLAASK